MKNPIRTASYKKLTMISFFALSLLLVTTLIAFLKNKEREENSRWVSHTLEVIASLENLNSLMYQLGNSQKFYLIAENKNFQKEYIQTLQVQERQQQIIRSLVIDNKDQVENLKEITDGIAELLSYYSQTIDLMNLNKKNEAMRLVNTGRGAVLLKVVTDKIEKMASLEKNLLNERMRSENQSRNSLNNIFFFVSFFGILTISGFIFLVYQESVRRSLIQIELNRNAQVQKAIVSAAAYALISTDKDGKITYYNPAAEKLLGYSEKEVLGQTPVIFHDSTEVAKMSEELSRRFNIRIPVGFEVFSYRAQNGIYESDQWSYIRKDGSRVQVKLTLTALYDDMGNITGYLGLAYDITQQLAFEEELMMAKEDALAGTRAKSEFLANMSHEIRTPMNAILGMAELLIETDLTEDQRKYVSIFQSAGGGLLNIINDILDLSKIEAGHFELNASRIQLSSIVSTATQIIAIKAHQKELELVVDFADDLHNFYHADGDRIRQILLNLLGNAIKFTKQGEVVLKMYQEGELEDGRKQIAIEVLDTGVGMSEEHLEKLFERFSQGDSSITKEFGGTGLGLNITKRLVELMDGTIEVQSTLGIGTRFKATIKLRPDLECLEEPEEELNIRGMKFLVADDNKTNRLILRKILENQGAIVTEAEDGSAAENLVNGTSEKFDVILIDGRMPKVDGYTLVEKIKLRDGKKPVLLMLTSDNRPGDFARSKELGVKVHLIKPILKKELLSSIGKAMKEPSPILKVEDKSKISSVIENKKISLLLVDDNDENRLVIKAFLKDQDVSIVEARNGQEALNEFYKGKFDIVLMDMQMPVMDGYSAVKELRDFELKNQKGYCPVVAFSAFALKEEIERSYLVGCNSHLSKPVSKKDLLGMLHLMTTPVIETVSDVMSDIVPEYIENRMNEVHTLEEAIKSENFKFIQSTGHKLAGSAGSYGLSSLTEIGRRLEESGREESNYKARHAISDYRMYMKCLEIKYSETA